MNAISRCPQCGTELPVGAAYGVCPKCLLQQGTAAQSLELEPDETHPLASRFPPLARRSRDQFVAPSPAELADHFPQLEILRLIGQGGMGAVYQARQRGLDRIVALKILPPTASEDPHFSERFNREARALARLNHPNIVAIYDSGLAGPYYYLVMEYVDGVNLRQAMLADKIQPSQTLEMVGQICDALQYAHNQLVVHRDIKPENVLIDQRGQIKVADFGLAKMVDPDLPDPMLTGTNQVMGTPRYMAPEQLEGTRAVDHRADIFSLGVVFYELLTGELPLGRFAPPSRKVQVDVRLDEVVLRTLEKQPDLRYQQASQLKTDVDSIRSGPSMRRGGYEYRSAATIFGVPWVHVAYGFDERTGKRRIAKGVIAIGDTAIGGVAIGGTAFGGLAIGGMAMGVFTIGGIGIGLLAIAGVAVGLISLGGMAVGYLAVGGFAIGVEPYGGAPIYLAGPPHQAPQLTPPAAPNAPMPDGVPVKAAVFAPRWWMIIAVFLLFVIGVPTAIVVLIVVLVARNRRASELQLPSAALPAKPIDSADSSSDTSTGCLVATIVAGILGALVLLVVVCGGAYFFARVGSPSNQPSMPREQRFDRPADVELERIEETTN